MKRRFLVLLLLTGLFCGQAPAQEWVKYKDFPLNVIPVDITANNAGTLFMLTRDNQIYYKTSAGSWTPMEGPMWDATGSSGLDLLNSSSIAVDRNSNRLYVGTDHLGLYYTSDFGDNWGNTFLETNPVSGFHENYSCFTEIRNSNLFFAGTMGGVTKFTSQGLIGQKTSFGNPFFSSPEALHYTNNGKLIIGTFNDGIWISDNNAASIFRTAFVTGQIYRFAEDANGRVYALSLNLATNTPSLLFSDDYMNWSTISLPNTSEQYTSLFFDPSTASLWLGSTTDIYVTPVAAISWQNKNNNNIDPNVKEIIGDNNGGLYCFSNQYVAQKRNAGANSWTAMNTGLSGIVNEIAFNADSKLFAGNRFFSNKISVLHTQTDNWRVHPVGTKEWGINKIIVDKQHQDHIYCNMAVNEVYKSTDNGETFNALNLPPGFTAHMGQTSLKRGEQSGLFAVKQVSEDSLMAKLFGSFDGGTSWDLLTTFEAGGIEDFAQDANGSLFVALRDSMMELHIYQSVDTGTSWNLVADFDFMFTLKFEGLQAAGTKTFLRARNELYTVDPAASGGITAVNLPWPAAGSDDKTIGALAVHTNGDMYIYYQGLYKSTDGGSNWSSLGKPAVLAAEAHIDDLDIAPDGTPYVTVSQVQNQANCGIYYYRPGGLGIKEQGSKHEWVMYPVPANDQLIIETSYRGQLTLCNTLGQQLQSVRISGPRTSLNLAGMASGIYFIRLEDNYSLKFVKE